MSTADRPQVLYLWGDDEWTMDRVVASVAEELARDTGALPERWREEGKAVTADVIAGRVAMAPMFGGGTVAVVANPSPLVRSREAREGLGRAIASVAPGNALIFLEFDGSGGRKRPKSLLDLADEVVRAGGTVRPCRAPSASELPAWIGGRAAAIGVRLGPDAAMEIAKRIGGRVGQTDVDRSQVSSMAVGELEKLALYRGAEPVTVDDVQALVPETVPSSLWALTDAVALRQAEFAGPALDQALEAQPEPVIVTLVHRRLRELLIAADARAAGARPPEIVRMVGGNPGVAQHRVDQSARWTVPELEAALDGLLDLDRMAKRAGAGAGTDGQRRMAWIAWVAERVSPRAPGGAGGGPSPARAGTSRR